MVIHDNFSRQKLADKFFCKKCLYTCSKESDFKKHLLTRKHRNDNKMVINDRRQKKVAVLLQQESNTNTNIVCDDKSVTNMATNDVGINHQKVAVNSPYTCQVCGQGYRHSSGLSRHRKRCIGHVVIEQHTDLVNLSNNHEEADNFKEIVLMLLKENKDIQRNFIELIPHIKGNNINTNTNSNNTNSNNTNNFNIQMFLNEHCKNAMNLTDFIDTLPLTPETFDNTIENGLTKSITTMITNGLNNMDILERPIHCTDPARKTMYIKDNDNWEKDNELNILLDGITKIALKQRSNISKWQDANLGWATDDDLQTKMTNLVFNSMTQIEKDDKETNKIIRAISKNTYLSNDIKNGYK